MTTYITTVKNVAWEEQITAKGELEDLMLGPRPNGQFNQRAFNAQEGCQSVCWEGFILTVKLGGQSRPPLISATGKERYDASLISFNQFFHGGR